MNLRMFQILYFLLWIGPGRMAEQPEKVVDCIPEKISETAVKVTLAKGIDVSHWQGKIDWDLVAKTEVKHVFIKMSEGASYVDPNFVKNWNGAQGVGLNVNCYHYFRALISSPKGQMENIKKSLKLVKFDPAENALAIDVESSGNEKATSKEMADNLAALLNLIKNDSDLSGLSVLIYTSSGFWNSKVNWNDYDFSAYGLWVAHWGVKSPQLPEPWKSKHKSWVWWQYSDKGKVSGITGDVDLDWLSI